MQQNVDGHLQSAEQALPALEGSEDGVSNSDGDDKEEAGNDKMELVAESQSSMGAKVFLFIC